MIKCFEIVAENWDVITLIITNVVALFVKPPKRKK